MAFRAFLTTLRAPLLEKISTKKGRQLGASPLADGEPLARVARSRTFTAAAPYGANPIAEVPDACAV
jgi:hypothetical protein